MANQDWERFGEEIFKKCAGSDRFTGLQYAEPDDFG